MRKIISRVGIGVAAMGVVSAVVLGIALNQPAVRPKTPDVKAVSDSDKKTPEETEKSAETIAVSNSKDDEAPTSVSGSASKVVKANSTPRTQAKNQPAVVIDENNQKTSDSNTGVITDANADADNADDSNSGGDNMPANVDPNTSATVETQEEPEEFDAWTPPSYTGYTSGRMTDVVNTYPYKDNCPRDNNKYAAYNGNVCQSTSYVSWKAYDKWGVTQKMGGHARSYVNANVYVPKTGINTYVNNTPAPYTIAVQTGGIYGHVMWVESVNENGSINVTEYNISWTAIGCYAGDFCSRRGVGTTGTYFIHFE